MACKIISEISIPGAGPRSECNEDGTVTLTLRKCQGTYETKLQIGDKCSVLEHVGKHDALVSFKAMKNKYLLMAEWNAKFD